MSKQTLGFVEVVPRNLVKTCKNSISICKHRAEVPYDPSIFVRVFNVSSFVPWSNHGLLSHKEGGHPSIKEPHGMPNDSGMIIPHHTLFTMV